MSFHQLPQPSSFEKARRREAYRRFARAVRGRSRASNELLPLDEVRDRLRLFDQTYVGIRPIRLDKIVGTAGRARDFDRSFLPRRSGVSERWKQVERVFPDSAFPPIVVYQIDDSYFVVDGHHRVAISRQRGLTHIDAEITRLNTSFKFPPGADLGRIIHAEQERIFMDESGLDRSRPEARIELSRSYGYSELVEIVKVFGFDLMTERDQVLSIEEVSGAWYDEVYLPAMDAIRREQLGEGFPQATEGDLFLWVYHRRRALFPERGGMGMEQAVREVKTASGPKPERGKGLRVPRRESRRR